MEWREVRPQLERVLELPEEEREAALERECGADAALLSRLRALLAAGRAQRELFAPIAPQELSPASPGAGERVGAWRLVELLGEGGMGRVWLAERADSDFRQRAALKLVKLGMDTEAVLRRFRRERQVLAELDHPGVVRLLDGGVSESGRPYMVMELVAGTPLDAHCRALALEARLALFARVCEAVDAAHELGIVHRDLKPANVLITAEGEPKVLDFGIAKTLADDGPEASLLTRTGERLLTPRYAAPEQVRGEACTPATDVYALGVMLYELLSDRAPYALEGATPKEIESAVCGEEPRRPSALMQGTQRRRVAGDLDVIALRSLAKDPARRYRDAGRFALDLRRHLAHQPIEARPDSVRYRVAKFVRRNRMLVGSALTVIAALAIGLGVAVAHSIESERLRLEADWSAYVARIGSFYANLERTYGNVLPNVSARPNRDLNGLSLAEAGEEGLRGWEWQHLRARSDLSKRLVFQTSGGSELALDGTGELLACIEGDEVVLIETATGDVRRRCAIASPRLPALSGDGALLACGTGDELVVLDLASGDERGSWAIDGSLARVCFLPGGTLLAAASRKETVLLSLEDPTFRRRLARWDSRDLVVAPDGSWLAVTGPKGTVQVFGIEDPELDATFQLSGTIDRVTALAVSSSGRYLAGATSAGVVQLWSLAERRSVSIPLHTRAYCTAIAFRADRDELFVAAAFLVVWDVESGRSRVLPGTGMTVRALVTHPTAPLAYTSTNDGRILEWRADAEPVPRHHLNSEECDSVSASPDGARYVAELFHAPDRLVLVDTASGAVLAARDHSIGIVRDLLHAPSGELLCAAPNAVLVLGGSDLHTIAELAISGPSCLALAPGGEVLWVGTSAGRLSRYRIADWTEIDERSTPLDEVQALVVHPNGRRATLIGSGEADAFDLDLGSGRFESHAATLGCKPLSVAVSPNGAWLAIGGTSRLQVRSCADGSVLLEDERHNVHALRFTPDGKRLLAADDGRLPVYDTERWSLVVTFKENGRGIQDLDLASNGTLLTSDYSGDVLVWRAAPRTD